MRGPQAGNTEGRPCLSLGVRCTRTGQGNGFQTQGPQAPRRGCPGRRAQRPLCREPLGQAHPHGSGLQAVPSGPLPSRLAVLGPQGPPCPPQCQPGGHPRALCVAVGRGGEGSRRPTAGKGAPGALTYGPEHGVKGARILPVRGKVHPGDAELLAWELLHPLGGAAPQDPGAVTSHVLGDQRSHLLRRVERVPGERPALGGGGRPAERPA